MLHARLMAHIANVNSKRKRTPKDFLPQWGGRRAEQSWQEQLQVVTQLNATLGGTDRRGGR